MEGEYQPQIHRPRFRVPRSPQGESRNRRGWARDLHAAIGKGLRAHPILLRRVAIGTAIATAVACVITGAATWVPSHPSEAQIALLLGVAGFMLGMPAVAAASFFVGADDEAPAFTRVAIGCAVVSAACFLGGGLVPVLSPWPEYMGALCAGMAGIAGVMRAMTE